MKPSQNKVGEMEVKIVRSHADAKIPTRNEGNAAYDLYAVENIFLQPGTRHVFKTGISLEIPDDFYIRIAGRSGLSAKGIDVLGGVVDPSYRGEIGAILINLSHVTHEIKPGDRIAQFIIEKFHTTEFKEVQSLSESDRGEKGFGSSGR